MLEGKSCYCCGHYSVNEEACKSCSFPRREQWIPRIQVPRINNMPNFDKHYADTAHQPIEVMQANMTHDEFVGFLKGNIIKYVCRLGKKDEPEKEAAKIRRYAEWLEQAVNGQTINPRK